jgi:hypothetical protein
VHGHTLHEPSAGSARSLRSSRLSPQRTLIVLAWVYAATLESDYAATCAAQAQPDPMLATEDSREPSPDERWIEIPCNTEGRLVLTRGSLHLADDANSLTVYGLSHVRVPTLNANLDQWTARAQFEQARHEAQTLHATVEYGKACSGANDEPACLNNLSAIVAKRIEASGSRAFAIVTAKGRVQTLKSPGDLRRALPPPISTSDEAVVVAALAGLPVACRSAVLEGTEVRRVDDGFEVRTKDDLCSSHSWISVQTTGALGKLHPAEQTTCSSRVRRFRH